MTITDSKNRNSRRIGAGLVAMTLPLLMLSLAAPVANAADVSSTVNTVDKCAWFMSTMKNFVISSSAKYRGAALELSNTDATVPEGSSTKDDLKLGLSASKSGGEHLESIELSTDCSFYNNKFGQKVIVTPDDQPFVATYEKASSEGGGDSVTTATEPGFTLAESNMNFVVDLRDEEGSSFCNTGFNTVGGALTASTGLTLIERALDNMQKDYAAAGSAPYCNPEITLRVTIPAVSEVPEGAGSTFTFTGPTLTFSKADN